MCLCEEYLGPSTPWQSQRLCLLSLCGHWRSSFLKHNPSNRTLPFLGSDVWRLLLVNTLDFCSFDLLAPREVSHTFLQAQLCIKVKFSKLFPTFSRRFVTGNSSVYPVCPHAWIEASWTPVVSYLKKKKKKKDLNQEGKIVGFAWVR